MGFYLDSYSRIHSTSVLVPSEVMRPSEYDGFSIDEEENFRLFGCELIQEGGVMLKLPQVTMVTAMELFHRFFFRQSFLRAGMKYTTAACIFLATKLDETPKRIRDVVSVFDYLYKIKEGVARPIPVIDLNSDEFMNFRQEVIAAERLILKEVGFVLNNLHVKPFKYLYYYLKVLRMNKALAQRAWNFVNDAYRVPVCVSFPPYVLAAAAIYLSSRTMDHPLPDLEWWLAFDCTFEEIEEVASEIMSLYQRKKVTLGYVIDTLAKRAAEAPPAPIPEETTPAFVSMASEGDESDISPDKTFSTRKGKKRYSKTEAGPRKAKRKTEKRKGRRSGPCDDGSEEEDTIGKRRAKAAKKRGSKESEEGKEELIPVEEEDAEEKMKAPAPEGRTMPETESVNDVHCYTDPRDKAEQNPEEGARARKRRVSTRKGRKT